MKDQNATPLIDIVVVIDTSRSMRDEAVALSEAAEAAIAAAESHCPADLRVAWFGLEATWRNTNFNRTLRNYLMQVCGVPEADIRGRKKGEVPRGGAQEDGARAIEDIADHFDWRPEATRAVFYLSDEALEGGGDRVTPEDMEAADIAIQKALSANVNVYMYLGASKSKYRDQLQQEYARVAQATGGISFTDQDTISGFSAVFENIICSVRNHAIETAATAALATPPPDLALPVNETAAKLPEQSAEVPPTATGTPAESAATPPPTPDRTAAESTEAEADASPLEADAEPPATVPEPGPTADTAEPVDATPDTATVSAEPATDQPAAQEESAAEPAQEPTAAADLTAPATRPPATTSAADTPPEQPSPAVEQESEIMYTAYAHDVAADGASHLYALDLSSGKATLIGAIGIPNITDIACHAATLYGVHATQLLRLDASTGQAIVIGDTGFTVDRLAAAPAGTLYGIGDKQVIAIDPATGAGTLIGDWQDESTFPAALAIAADGRVHAVLHQGAQCLLATLELTDGATTVIGDIGFTEVNGLAFCAERLYGVTGTGQLLAIDPTTGAGTLVAETNPQRPWRGLSSAPHSTTQAIIEPTATPGAAADYDYYPATTQAAYAATPATESEPGTASRNPPTLPALMPDAALAEAEPSAPVYVLDYFAGHTSHLFTLNVTTGKANLIGPIEQNVADIAFWGSTLYGIKYIEHSSASQLLKIDPATGRGELIGAIGFLLDSLIVANGTLYGIGRSQLIAIDPVKGGGRLIGHWNTALRSNGGMTVDRQGRVYVTLVDAAHRCYLATLDIHTAQVSVIGDTGFSYLYGIDFWDETLYGVTGDGALVRLNPVNGTGTLLMQTQPKLYWGGMSIYPAAASQTAAESAGLPPPAAGAGTAAYALVAIPIAQLTRTPAPTALPTTSPSVPATPRTLWQIGKPAQTSRGARKGGAEFLSSGDWTAEFNYQIGADADPIAQPSLPAMITVPGGRRPNKACTDKLNIHFTLEHDYAEGELTFFYNRYGAEEDSIYLDDRLIAEIEGAGEGKLQESQIPLGPVERGEHVLSVTTRGGRGGAHYVDYFALQACAREEPTSAEPTEPSSAALYFSLDPAAAKLVPTAAPEVSPAGLAADPAQTVYLPCVLLPATTPSADILATPPAFATATTPAEETAPAEQTLVSPPVVYLLDRAGDNVSHLYTLSLASGETALTSDIAATAEDLAWAEGELFGVGADTEKASAKLLKIDPAAGQGIVLGDIGFAVSSLAYSARHRALFGLSRQQLIRIDPTTGAGTVAVTFDAQNRRADNLAFDPQGQAYLIFIDEADNRHLTRLDPDTGDLTEIGELGAWTIASMDYYGGALYAVTGGDATARGQLVRIEPASCTTARLAETSPKSDWVGLSIG